MSVGFLAPSYPLAETQAWGGPHVVAPAEPFNLPHTTAFTKHFFKSKITHSTLLKWQTKTSALLEG